jgi:hypothetical protein
LLPGGVGHDVYFWGQSEGGIKNLEISHVCTGRGTECKKAALLMIYDSSGRPVTVNIHKRLMIEKQGSSTSNARHSYY